MALPVIVCAKIGRVAQDKKRIKRYLFIRRIED
jgi:hypothetical protein